MADSHLESRTIKSSNDGWVWFAWGMGLATLLLFGLPRRSTEVWFGVFIVLLISGFATAASLWHRIIITASSITVYEVFSKTELLFAEIENMKVKKVSTGKGAMFMLEISGSSLPKSPLLFSLVLYSENAILRLVADLKYFAPHVDMRC